MFYTLPEIHVSKSGIVPAAGTPQDSAVMIYFFPDSGKYITQGKGIP
jgi:hypothetical protein